MNSKKMTPGFVLVAVTTILALVCTFLYKSAMIQNSLTYVLMIAAAVAGALALVLAMVKGQEIANFVAMLHTILIMVAIGNSIAPMVNEMGLVFAGLNPTTNLTGFLTFVVVSCIAWLISVIASFMGIIKQEA